MPELTHDTTDDAFHEIQLSGKQLVFLFMVTTAVSILIFLCGVFVGRGARAEGISADPTTATTTSPTTGPVAEQTAPAQPVAEPPAPATEGALTYHDRLSSDKPPAEKLKPQTEEARAKEPPAVREELPNAKAEPPKPSPTPPATAAPSAAAQNARPGTWAVQVVSLRDKAAATRIIQRLDAKGYPAFLVPPRPGAPAPVYRVQVGRYSDRQEAQRVSERLKKEEQFDPWIIR